jgi:aspartokinase
METTTELTNKYIKEHPDIKSCLKKGLINYSSLARLVAKDLNIEKKTSMEAILIAARRFQDKLKKEQGNEKKIKDILSNSEFDIRNKIIVYIFDKNLDFDKIIDAQKHIRKEYGVIYILEGSDNYTVVVQKKHSELLERKLKSNIIKKNDDLVLINFKSSKEIEDTPGVVSYITSLFSENGVNIIEFFSCWTDTVFVIESKDVNKAIDFLKF